MASGAVFQRIAASDEKLKYGSLSITTAGTPQPLMSSSTPCVEVLIQVFRANTGGVYIGGLGMASQTGIYLSPPPSSSAQPVDITLSAQNLNQIWVDSDVSGEGVKFLYW